MNADRLGLLIISISILVGLALAFLPEEPVRTQEIVFHTNGTVVNQTGEETKQLGIVSNPEFRFGSIPVGSASLKFLQLDAPRKSLVAVESYGNISENLEHSNYLYFKGERRVSVRFNGTEPGFYEGSIRVKTWVPNNEWGSRWIDLRHQAYRLFY